MTPRKTPCRPALRLTVRVQAGHKREIIAPELTEGEEVTVIITSPGALAPSAPEDRATLAQRLLAQGAIPAGRSGPPPRLIAVRGRPVSETIIEDRGRRNGGRPWRCSFSTSLFPAPEAFHERTECVPTNRKADKHPFPAHEGGCQGHS